MKYVTLALFSLFAGCAGSPSPEQHLYFLSADTQPGVINEALTIGIGVIEVAPYLKRSEIMLQVGPQELRPARYHQWAEPLQASVRRYLRDQLSSELATAVDTNRQFRNNWQMQVDIAIDKFHGDLDGQVLLDAHYAIQGIADPTQQKRGRVRISGNQNGSGYAALVDAEEALLDRLAGQIATAIRGSE